ncbi:hypothetical protein B0H13DRAFT_2358158 [Mycena leptocephala]|nr:hypothetical protein B0H13DRAFT_2358158 [Mycena leptocephala]
MHTRRSELPCPAPHLSSPRLRADSVSFSDPITHLLSHIPHFLASFLPNLARSTPDALPMDNLATHTRRALSLSRMRLHPLDRSRSRSLCHTPPLRRPPPSPAPALLRIDPGLDVVRLALYHFCFRYDARPPASPLWAPQFGSFAFVSHVQYSMSVSYLEGYLSHLEAYIAMGYWLRFSPFRLTLTGVPLLCRLGTIKMGSLIRTPTEQEFDDLLSFVFSFAFVPRLRRNK